MAKFKGDLRIFKSLKDFDLITSSKLFGQNAILNASLEILREAAFIPRLEDPFDLGTDLNAFFKLISQVQQLRKFDLTGKNQWLQLLVDAEPQEFEENYLQVLFDLVKSHNYTLPIGFDLSIRFDYENPDNVEHWIGWGKDPNIMHRSGISYYLVRDYILQKNLLEIRDQQSREVVFSGGISNPRFVEKIELDGNSIHFPKEFFEGTPKFDSDFEPTIYNLLEIFMEPYVNPQVDFYDFVDDYRDPLSYNGENREYEIPFVADMTISYKGVDYFVRNMPLLLKFEHDLNFNFDDCDWKDFDPLKPTQLNVGVKYASEELALGLICKALFHKKEMI